MTQNDSKLPQNDPKLPKWPKNEPKWPKNLHQIKKNSRDISPVSPPFSISVLNGHKKQILGQTYQKLHLEGCFEEKCHCRC